MNEAKPPATSINGGQKRSKISFSEEVLSKDKIGDGNKVDVKEERGIFLSLLGQRRVVSNNNNHQSIGEEGINGVVAKVVAKVIFGNGDKDTNDDDGLLKQKLAYSEKQYRNIIQSSSVNNEENEKGSSDDMEYDNLIVKIGLLKIGHRYKMIVPVPSQWGLEVEGDNNEQPEAVNTYVRIVEDSLDDDLRGEIEAECSNPAPDDLSSCPSAVCHHYLIITLSAKRRGPYRGRFVLELTRLNQPPLIITSSEKDLTQKCIMSVQVDATIMGKDMGTPKLRNGVVCLGKIVGYDSDEETEWQGFD